MPVLPCAHAKHKSKGKLQGTVRSLERETRKHGNRHHWRIHPERKNDVLAICGPALVVEQVAVQRAAPHRVRFLRRPWVSGRNKKNIITDGHESWGRLPPEGIVLVGDFQTAWRHMPLTTNSDDEASTTFRHSDDKALMRFRRLLRSLPIRG